ncbi:hypothetical protein DM793_12750 [Paenarthrobacter nitroguajacolicus]|uniref:hypothetical protein n=1 Tax=Paenarthrobacter nitroguajacolicus TaxID=211146 RepID=UPI0015BC7298|nr:hypothetical protein [Paenarthrobacter nitroguajacolicus]NWL12151.1 hypothetical protein [Paenarthrobacter nitroguajacolicus]
MATEVPGSLTTYGYDKQNRLTSATQGTTVEGWTYDKNSNRNSATKTGTATVHSTYNAADQLCWTATTNGACSAAPAGATTYTYDANGNTTNAGTTTSAFNVFNQVTSTTVAGAMTNFAYAGLRNDERTSAGSTTHGVPIGGSLNGRCSASDRCLAAHHLDCRDYRVLASTPHGSMSEWVCPRSRCAGSG